MDLNYRMVEMRQLAIAAVVLVVSASGCYSPTLLDCSISCGTGGSCPEGTQCGADSLCHIGALDSCNSGGGPDGANGTPDARRIGDAAPGKPDSPATADAPPAQPDAPSACPTANFGEPDDQCPGENIGPVVEGTPLTVTSRMIYPARDVDTYEAPVQLKPVSTCPSNQLVTYAMRVTLAPPQGTELRLRRFNADRVCNGSSDRAGLSFCIPFVVSCAGPIVPPTFFFAVDGNGASTAVCQPYSMNLHVCGAGSTCDSCRN